MIQYIIIYKIFKVFIDLASICIYFYQEIQYIEKFINKIGSW